MEERKVYKELHAKFIEVCKAEPTKIIGQIPKAVEIMTAISVMEWIYPELKSTY